MSRPALISLPLVESVEHFGDVLAEVSMDGVMTPDEQRTLLRLYRPIERRVQRLHTGLQFVSRAITGDGIDGAWAERMWREDRKDRLHVVVHNDDPDPDGPGGQKRAA